MAPPCFSDLGKQAKDIFNKNYHIGVMKLECKTKTSTGVNFTVSGTSNNDTGRINAFLETKYLVKDYGFTIKEKWTTDNVLATQLVVEDQFVKGLKLTLDTTFAPQTGKKSGSVQTAFQNDHVHLNGDVDLDGTAPQLHGAGVIKYQNWLIGAKLSHDFGQNKVTKSNVGVGYCLGDFIFHSSVTDGHEFGGCMYQKVNENLESGMTLTWAAGTNETKFGLGCNYKIDDDTSFRAKVNNSSQIGISFTHRLKKGIQLTLSALIDGKSFNQGGHKLGLGLELEG